MPVPIVAPQSPGDCFDAAVEAVAGATQVLLRDVQVRPARPRELGDAGARAGG